MEKKFSKNPESLLENLGEIYANYKKKTKFCLSVKRILDVAKNLSEELTYMEKVHTESCQNCYKKLMQLCCKEIAKDDLPSLVDTGFFAAAAGSPNEDSMSFSLSDNYLDTQTQIIFEKEENGYNIYIVADIPITFTIVFMKEDKELSHTKISREFSENVIPFEEIEGWNKIKLFRE